MGQKNNEQDREGGGVAVKVGAVVYSRGWVVDL